jgi:hypothetical protein
MRRFVILAQGPRGGRVSLKSVLKEKGVAYWHYIGGAWLVVDPQSRDQAWWHAVLRTRVAQGGRLVVIDAEGGAFSARGPSKMFPWLRTKWSGENSG